MWNLFSGGYAGSNLPHSPQDKLVDLDYSSSGMAKYMVKDLTFAADAAPSGEVDALLLAALRAASTSSSRLDWSGEDIAVVTKLVEER